VKQYFDQVEKYFQDKKHDFVTRCMVCGNKNHPEFMLSHAPKLKSCLNCGFTWSYKQPTEEVLNKFYTQSVAMDTWAEIKQTKAEHKRQMSKYKWGYKYIKKHKINNVFDYGCGDGFFLDHLKVDKKKGYELKDKVTPGNYVECITMWGVLEHLKNPAESMRLFGLNNYPDYFIICVPNIDSLVAQILGSKCCTFCPQHLWFFNIETLTKFMSKFGYDLDTWTTIEPETQPIIKQLSKMPPYVRLGNMKLKHPWINDKEILKNKLGYKIIAAFKERKTNGEQTD